MNRTTTRRTFFSGAAVLATPLAAAAAVAARADDDLAARLAALEDANEIRELLLRQVQRINSGTDSALGAHVRSVTLDADGTFSVATDVSATAQVPCTVETAMPIEGGGTLAEMARLQGDGAVKRSERRVLRSSFVKREGAWTIDQLELSV